MNGYEVGFKVHLKKMGCRGTHWFKKAFRPLMMCSLFVCFCFSLNLTFSSFFFLVFVILNEWCLHDYKCLIIS